MIKTFQGKSIIVGTPKDFDINKMIIKELRNTGFESVFEISFNYQKFKYKNIWQHAKSFYKKNFGNRPHYKQLLRFQQIESNLIQELNEIQDVDYVLLIRPDIYSPTFIDALKKKSKTIVAYQWDGLNRFPAVNDVIQKFDRFFIFDPADLGVEGVLPLTNFSPISYTAEELFDSERITDVYFSGSYFPKRAAVLGKILSQLNRLGKSIKYRLNAWKPRENKKYNLTTTKEFITFEENLKNSYNAEVVIDLVFTGHKGLSFRIFEAIRFDKKVITTNQAILKYDFYDPDNIFIWSSNSKIQELKRFLETPVNPLSDVLKRKYGFENWIKYVLDEGDFIPIDLPEN
ncbi:hypothetical protein [Sphingobacterium corticibacter]|uniref:Lipopolysaccharide biosynthesis protein n=1 Tax=Sphingobacterium corticibacter TaxID=2171749 RepID=A0A2T8HJQ9_9SPHI|nr:hypothetical protein [Sphingobacterium corticibacter]PVH25633.1 hypothetical protein DC487_06730 [Sphingobacterium corticibacter]